MFKLKNIITHSTNLYVNILSNLYIFIMENYYITWTQQAQKSYKAAKKKQSVMTSYRVQKKFKLP